MQLEKWHTHKHTHAHTHTHRHALTHLQGLSLGFLLTELWWPCSAEEAITAGLVQQLPNGSLAVSTSDSSARMVRKRTPRYGNTALCVFDPVWKHCSVCP